MAHRSRRARRKAAMERRRRRRRFWRLAFLVGVGVMLLGLVGWAIFSSLQRSALARAAESQPPVVGTPVVGGHDMTNPVPAAVPLLGEAQPRVLIPRDHYSFGLLSIAGPPVEQSFRVLNVGQADLQIAGVRTSCGCTTARVSASSIPPGENAELVVQFDPQVHPQPGDYTREVYLYTNDPRQPEAVVTISVSTR